MSIINILRIVPRDTDFLNRKLGSRGEIFYDRDSNTLRLYDGATTGGFKLAKASLDNVSNATFFAKAEAAGVGAAGITTFKTISVAGQSNIVADSATDTLTLVAGAGISLTTDASSDTITITGDGYVLPTASTSVLGGVKVDGTTVTIANGVISASPVTASVTDPFTFNVAADDSVQIEVTSGNTVKFIGLGSVTTNTNAEGEVIITGAEATTTFTSLTDVATAGITLDQVYSPASTVLTVTRTGSTAYNFDQYSGGNPTIYVLSGTIIAFKLSVAGHPFLIQDPLGSNYNTGLTHVTTAGVVTTGTNAQGKTSGTLYWKVPYGISGNYRYQCGIHSAMVGPITVKDIASI